MASRPTPEVLCTRDVSLVAFNLMSEQALDYTDVLNEPASADAELAAAAGKKKAKRKMSPKARKAALKNLAKARSAQRAKKHRGTKAKAKTKSVRKARRTAKQKAAALKNLKKARSTRRKKSKTHRLTTRRASRSTSRASEAKTMAKKKRTAKQRAASRRNIKKAQQKLRRIHPKGKFITRKKNRGSKAMSKRGKTLARRSAKRTAVAAPTPRKTKKRGRSGKKRRFTQKARAAAMRNLGKARSARRRAKAAGRKHAVRAYSYHSRPKRVKVPAHRSYERKKRQSKKARAASLRNLRKARAAQRHGGHRRSGMRSRRGYMKAMENAITGVEGILGTASAIVWFMVTDFVDRLLATHSLTDKGAKDAAGNELYMDTPPITGSYAGAFNPTAICAPMDATRWLVGLLAMQGVPFLVSFAVSNDLARTTIQMGVLGGTVRIVGKALIDLTAYIVMWNPVGQQLYDGEMRAQNLVAGNTTALSSLPSTGLGSACGECTACTKGVGACSGKAAGAGSPQGAGYPSMPRENANSPSTSTPPSEGGRPPPPPAPPPAHLSPGGSPLAGLPERRNPHLWGAREEEVAA